MRKINFEKSLKAAFRNSLAMLTGACIALYIISNDILYLALAVVFFMLFTLSSALYSQEYEK